MLKMPDLQGILMDVLKNDDHIHPILHFDKAIEGWKKKLDELDKEVENKTYDANFFQCAQFVEDLKIKAVGCRNVCPICGRKCEREPHIVDD